MDETLRHVKEIVLGAVAQCTACDRPYDQADVDVVGQRGDLWVLRLLCASCRREGFVAALLSAMVPGDPPVTVVPLPISQDDIDGIRDFLDRFDGDLAAYLAPND